LNFGVSYGFLQSVQLYKNLVGIFQGKRTLGSLDVGDRIILK